MINNTLGVSRVNYDMVTGNGNGPSASGQANPFRTPANPRAMSSPESALGTRTPQGTVTFMQHIRNRGTGRPARSPHWREFLTDLPTTTIFDRNSISGIDPAAPAPIVGHSSIRLSDIHKLPSKVHGFDGHWEKFSLTFDLHPNLHSIHTCKIFKLPYPNAVETTSSSITDIVMSYGTMGDVDKFENETEDQDNSAEEAIERLTIGVTAETDEEAAIRRSKLEELAANIKLRNKLVQRRTFQSLQK